MGEDGALVARRGGDRVRIAAPTIHAVDGTGAGDAFMAGMIAGHLAGLSLEDQGRLACAAGALAASAVGATAGITSRLQVEQLGATLDVVPLR
jgi:ribokinase